MIDVSSLTEDQKIKIVKAVLEKGISYEELGIDRGAIQGSFANCNISVDLDLFNKGITEYI